MVILDPSPTWLVKELCDVLAPIIISMANASFTHGLFPDSHKLAVVHPRIKKPSLGSLDIKSYRPNSSLSLVYKNSWALGREPDERPCQPVWSVYSAAVSMPAAPLHWDGGHNRSQWHRAFHSRRLRVCLCAAGSQRSVRHRWSRHTFGGTHQTMRCPEIWLVPFLSHRTHADFDNFRRQLGSSHAYL